jgi:hypothetical protein
MVQIMLSYDIAACQNSGTLQPHEHGCVMYDTRNISTPQQQKSDEIFQEIMIYQYMLYYK